MFKFILVLGLVSPSAFGAVMMNCTGGGKTVSLTISSAATSLASDLSAEPAVFLNSPKAGLEEVKTAIDLKAGQVSLDAKGSEGALTGRVCAGSFSYDTWTSTGQFAMDFAVPGMESVTLVCKIQGSGAN